MKLLFMIPRLSYSGAPKMMAWVSNKMCELGYEVQFVSIYDSKNQQLLNKKIKYIQLNNKQSTNWVYRNTIGMIKSIISYRKIVKEYRPDVIISFLDSVSYAYIFLNHIFWKDKILVSERVDPFSRKGWRAKLCFYIMGLGDHIVFQTEEARNFFGHKFDMKSSVICNPVILNNSIDEIIKSRKAEKEPSKDIALVGRISIEQKRQDIAIKAMKEVINEYPDYKLNIFGSGPDEEKVRQMIAEFNLNESVILKGQKDNIPKLISNYTCFILTSDFEGIPNALIEAMSIGLPCISTDCSPGGAKMLIDNGINGFLVEKGNYKELSEKIKRVIENKEESRKIGLNAIKISSKFSEEKIAKLWEFAIESTKKNI